ncbi:MAG TPA: hypothetical protein P5215_05570 [Bacteroidales bacterium]|nr:hypothetical protein [Bacteroidales bacterium]
MENNKKKNTDVEETTPGKEKQPLKITVFTYIAVKGITGVPLARFTQYIKSNNLEPELKTYKEWEQEYLRS